MSELKEDIMIDKYNLDVEWENHPELFEKWSKKLVKAESERDYLKDCLEVDKATLELEIRESPKKFGLDKVTEGAIKSIILLNKDIQEAGKKLSDANDDVKNLAIKVRKFDSHRKEALKKLTELYIQGYFLRHKPAGKIQEMEKEVSQSVKKEQNEMLKNTGLTKRTRRKRED